ncbi:hypothetical protein EWM64_g8204 [Hericium alpestre]|uniref:Uncharacterized protein n=1 Tax=Hericium alpestre TaxID=135208 RepID=A0A4Y9ZP28_9AGAM|nr:hypothetical protein EWM64_g8204 [Hericium alpestre]
MPNDKVKPIDVAVIGVGLVGSEFLKQVIESPHPFRLVLISSSKTTIFSPNGICFPNGDWKGLLKTSSPKLNLSDVIPDLAASVKRGAHVVVVDNTSSDDVAGLLDGQLRAEDMGRALAKYRFRMDPTTMKVVTIEEGEEGYETARSAPWSRSTFAGLVDRFGDKEGESSLSDDGARGAWFGRLGSKRASMPLPMRRESARL